MEHMEKNNENSQSLKTRGGNMYTWFMLGFAQTESP